MADAPLIDDTSHVVDEANELAFRTVFRPGCVDVIRGRIGPSSLLSQLVSLLVRAGIVHRNDGEDLIRSLLERERFGSTALGRGLAIPHLQTDAVSQHAGAALGCPDGVNFFSLDGNPTFFIVLLLSPRGSREQHSQLMSRLAGLMNDKRLTVVKQPGLTPGQLHELLIDLGE